MLCYSPILGRWKKTENARKEKEKERSFMRMQTQTRKAKYTSRSKKHARRTHHPKV
jgi:hypothetical protein